MFFNYTTNWANNWWERRSFLHAWWKLYEGDPRLAPPDYHATEKIVCSPADPLYTRLDSQLLYMEALPRRTSSTSFNPNAPVTASLNFEEPVAAAVLQIDRRRDDGAGYLGLLRCTNDEETLERLLAQAFEYAAEQGCTSLLGPTGIMPGWQPGALLNHFNRVPPWHTPYNPPYAGELYAAVMEPWLATTLYEAVVPDKLPLAPAPAAIEPLQLERLAGDLRALLAASLHLDDAFPSPDELEAQALLNWLQATVAARAWLATVDGAPAGFVMLQPDLAPLLHRTGGGRRWPGRGYLALRKNKPAAAGRLLLGTVAPQWRNQGIGLQLWRQALEHAQQAGWYSISCGPVVPASDAATFLTRQGARSQQEYMLFRWSPW